MPNPFVYGEIVPVAAFVDREAELERLTGDLVAGQKVFLISPRRYGKSSLIRQSLRAASRAGALTVEMTVSRDYGETAAEKSNELLLHMLIAVISVSLLIWLTLGFR